MSAHKYTRFFGLALLVGVFCFPQIVKPTIMTSSDAPTITNVYRVMNITGDGSPNRTDLKYQVYGTDLGIMWDNGSGQVMFAFGDTYGKGWGGCGTGPRKADWRSNVLALSATKDPSNGLSFSSMSQDSGGHAKELLGSKKIDNLEETVIPTAGISVGTRNYMHYMSVHHWGAPGHWFTNFAGIAYSDDNGQTWQHSDSAIWPNSKTWEDNFQQAAFVRDGGYIYMFGTPNGRFGNAYLARVPENAVLQKDRYQYWDGSSWQINNEAKAVPVVAAPVAELSVQYNTHFGKWIMTYLDEERGWLVLRESTSLTGPWSGQKLILSRASYPDLYGGFIHPWFNTSTDLYFTLSQWCSPELRYNVSLMHATLDLASASANLLSDGDFERQAPGNPLAPWRLQGRGGIDFNSRAKSGQNNGWLRSSNGWNGLFQTVALVPNQDYNLSAWFKTSASNFDGAFGVRTTDGKVIKASSFSSSADFHEQHLIFNSGANPLVQVYFGFWGNGTDSWLNIDDISLRPLPVTKPQ